MTTERLLTGLDAVHVLRAGRSCRALVEYRIVESTAGDVLRYSVTIVGRNRRKDGTLGYRRGPIHYTDLSFDPAVCLVDAAEWLLARYPEVTATLNPTTQED